MNRIPTVRAKAIGVSLALALLTACSPDSPPDIHTAGSTTERLKNDATESAHELKQDARTASAEISQSAQSAASEARQDMAEVRAEAKAKFAEAKAKTKQEIAEAKAGLKEGSATTGDALKDAAVTASVKMKLAEDPKLSALKINVDTTDGKVLLKGSAPDQSARARAATLAATVDGVKTVDNRLAIAP